MALEAGNIKVSVKNGERNITADGGFEVIAE